MNLGTQDITTIRNIKEVFTDIANRHYQIENIGWGRDAEIGATELTYPILWVVPTSARMIRSEQNDRYTSLEVIFNVKVLDLVQKDRDDQSDVTSDTFQILTDVVNEFNDHPFYQYKNMQLVNDINFDEIEEFSDDETFGWSTNITVRLRNITSWCGIPAQALEGYNNVTPQGFTATTNGLPIDVYTTGATLSGSIVSFDRNDLLSAYTIDLSSLTGSSASLWSASTGAYSIIANNGTGNLASGQNALVAGRTNTASADNTAIVGGLSNRATAVYSFIGGGQINLSSGQNSFIGGGISNSATTNYSVVVGGDSNLASGTGSFIGGGLSNSATTYYSAVVGGSYNNASGNKSSVIGGELNTASGNYSSVIGGQSNLASNSRSSVVGGQSNTASGTNSFIGAGRNNSATAIYSVVIGGLSNTASNSHSSVVGGRLNISSGSHSFIGGGLSNSATTIYSSIIGGQNNLASGQNSIVIGSSGSTLSGQRSIILGGQSIIGTANDTAYVPYLNIGSLSATTTATTQIDLVINSNGDVMTNKLFYIGLDFTITGRTWSYTAPEAFKINSIDNPSGMTYTILNNSVTYTLGNTISLYDNLQISGNTMVGFLKLNSELI